MPDPSWERADARLFEAWSAAERAAVAAELAAGAAERDAVSAERTAVAAEQLAERALRTLRVARDRYVAQVNDLVPRPA